MTTLLRLVLLLANFQCVCFRRNKQDYHIINTTVVAVIVVVSISFIKESRHFRPAWKRFVEQAQNYHKFPLVMTWMLCIGLVRN